MRIGRRTGNASERVFDEMKPQSRRAVHLYDEHETCTWCFGVKALLFVYSLVDSIFNASRNTHLDVEVGFVRINIKGIRKLSIDVVGRANFKLKNSEKV